LLKKKFSIFFSYKREHARTISMHIQACTAKIVEI